MTQDSYDLLNQALFLWQQNAMAVNNAGDINKKNNFSIDLSVLTNEGQLKIKDVYFDQRSNSIVFDTTTIENKF